MRFGRQGANPIRPRWMQASDNIAGSGEDTMKASKYITLWVGCTGLYFLAGRGMSSFDALLLTIVYAITFFTSIQEENKT